MMGDSGRILIGRQRICEYLVIGKKKFYDLVQKGMPAFQDKDLGKWVSHEAELDNYFLNRMKKTMNKKPP